MNTLMMIGLYMIWIGIAGWLPRVAMKVGGKLGQITQWWSDPPDAFKGANRYLLALMKSLDMLGDLVILLGMLFLVQLFALPLAWGIGWLELAHVILVLGINVLTVICVIHGRREQLAEWGRQRRANGLVATR